MKRSLVWLAFAILLCACAVSQSDGCIPPPQGFSGADLAGTWVAGLSWRKDTLVIRENGTYKQSIHIGQYTEALPFDYESDWQSWRLEYDQGGMPYLHLDGMRLCAYSGGYVDCEVVGGGDTPEAKWYDFCKKQWIQMPGEGVLIIQGWPGTGSVTTRDVNLFLLQRGEDVWAYRCLDTSTPIESTTSPR